MTSRATSRFWKCFERLPIEIQKLAEKNYAVWQSDPQHPSLDFKRLRGPGNRFSVRIGIHYRAIGWMPSSGHVEWVWIGSHAEYDRMVK